MSNKSYIYIKLKRKYLKIMIYLLLKISWLFNFFHKTLSFEISYLNNQFIENKITVRINIK